MITIKNVRNLLGAVETLVVPSEREENIDAEGNWILFPAAIDVGANVAANWSEFARKAVEGGVTTVFYVSQFTQNLTLESVKAQTESANTQLCVDKVPLNHHTYFELEANSIEELGKYKNQMAAIAIPKRLILDENEVDRMFQLAAQEDCIVAVICDGKDPQKTRRAIVLAEKYSTQLLLLNISHPLEIEFLREAKKSELLVYSAVSVSALQDQDALWEAIYDKTFDLVASSSHIESDMILPTLLNGYSARKVTLEGIVALTRTNAENIFRLNYSSDITLVDLEKVKTASNGKKLKGWPCCTIFKGSSFAVF